MMDISAHPTSPGHISPSHNAGKDGKLFRELLGGSKIPSNIKRRPWYSNATTKPGLYPSTKVARDALRQRYSTLVFDFPTTYSPQLRPPNFSKIHSISTRSFENAKRGILTGIFAHGALYCATELKWDVDLETALIKINDFHLRTKYLPNKDEDRSSLGKLFYISVAANQLPLYHFWLGHNEPNPAPQRMKDILDQAFDEELGPLPEINGEMQIVEKSNGEKLSTEKKRREELLKILPGDRQWEELEASFERLLKKGGLGLAEKFLTGDEISRLRDTAGKADISESAESRSAKNRLQADSVSTVAFKMTKLKLGRPISPIRKDEPLTREDEAEIMRSRLGLPKFLTSNQLFEYGESTLSFLDDYSSIVPTTFQGSVSGSLKKSASCGKSPRITANNSIVSTQNIPVMTKHSPFADLKNGKNHLQKSPQVLQTKSKVSRAHEGSSSQTLADKNASNDHPEKTSHVDDPYEDSDRFKVYGIRGFVYLGELTLKEFLRAAGRLNVIDPGSKDWTFTVDVESLSKDGTRETSMKLSYEMDESTADLVFSANVKPSMVNGNNVRIRTASDSVTMPFEKPKGFIKFHNEEHGMFYSTEVWTKKHLESASDHSIQDRSHEFWDVILELLDASVSEVEIINFDGTKLSVSLEDPFEAFHVSLQREIDQTAQLKGFVRVTPTKFVGEKRRAGRARKSIRQASSDSKFAQSKSSSVAPDGWPNSGHDSNSATQKRNKGKSRLSWDADGAASIHDEPRESLQDSLEANYDQSGRKIKRAWDSKTLPRPVSYEQFLDLVVNALDLSIDSFSFMVYEGHSEPNPRISHHFTSVNESSYNEKIYHSIDWDQKRSFAYICPRWETFEISGVNENANRVQEWRTADYRTLSDGFTEAARFVLGDEAPQSVTIIDFVDGSKIWNLHLPPTNTQLEHVLAASKINKIKIALADTVEFLTNSVPDEHLDDGRKRVTFQETGNPTNTIGVSNDHRWDAAEFSSNTGENLVRHDEEFEISLRNFNEMSERQKQLDNEREDARLHQPSIYGYEEPAMPLVGAPRERRIGSATHDSPSTYLTVPTLSEHNDLLIRLERAENELLARDTVCRVCGIELSSLTLENKNFHYETHRARVPDPTIRCPICFTTFNFMDDQDIAIHFWERHPPRDIQLRRHRSEQSLNTPHMREASQEIAIYRAERNSLLGFMDEVATCVDKLYQEDDMILGGRHGQQSRDTSEPRLESSSTIEAEDHQKSASFAKPMRKRKRVASAGTSHSAVIELPSSALPQTPEAGSEEFLEARPVQDRMRKRKRRTTQAAFEATDPSPAVRRSARKKTPVRRSHSYPRLAFSLNELSPIRESTDSERGEGQGGNVEEVEEIGGDKEVDDIDKEEDEDIREEDHTEHNDDLTGENEDTGPTVMTEDESLAEEEEHAESVT